MHLAKLAKIINSYKQLSLRNSFARFILNICIITLAIGAKNRKVYKYDHAKNAREAAQLFELTLDIF
jgi:hypothetical protein